MELPHSGRRSGYTKAAIAVDLCAGVATDLISRAISGRIAFADDENEEHRLLLLCFHPWVVGTFDNDNATDGRAANRLNLQAANVGVTHIKPGLFAVMFTAIL